MGYTVKYTPSASGVALGAKGVYLTIHPLSRPYTDTVDGGQLCCVHKIVHRNDCPVPARKPFAGVFCILYFVEEKSYSKN